MKFRVQTALVALLLWGTWWLLLEIPVALGLAGAGIATVVGFLARLRMDRIGWLVLLNYAYWLASGLLTGAIGWDVPLRGAFWAGEGRGFLYYLPLLAFAVLPAARVDLRRIARLLGWIAVATIGVFLLWLVGVDGPLAMTAGDRRFFVGFLTSHTGAGTFFGGIWVFLTVRALVTRSRKVGLLSLALLPAVLATLSRQSAVAAAIGLGLVVLAHRGGAAFRKLAIGGALVAGLLLAVSPQVATHLTGFLSARTLDRLPGTVERSGQQTEMGVPISVDQFEDQNVQTRFALWAYAVRGFLWSPVVGIGYGRFNDSVEEWSGRRGLWYLATKGRRAFSEQIEFAGGRIASAGNAHNSYLQILSETGLLGLALFATLWLALFRRIARLSARAAGDGDVEVLAYAEATRGLLFFALIGALFGNAMTAPSLGLLVMPVGGAAIAYERCLGGSNMRPATAARPRESKGERVGEAGDSQS